MKFTNFLTPFDARQWADDLTKKKVENLLENLKVNVNNDRMLFTGIVLWRI